MSKGANDFFASSFEVCFQTNTRLQAECLKGLKLFHKRYVKKGKTWKSDVLLHSSLHKEIIHNYFSSFSFAENKTLSILFKYQPFWEGGFSFLQTVEEYQVKDQNSSHCIYSSLPFV